MEKSIVPVLLAKAEHIGDSGNLLIKAWCPYCESYHHHGWPKEDLKIRKSHRSAHCFKKDSPFRNGGYYLKLDRNGRIYQNFKSLHEIWIKK